MSFRNPTPAVLAALVLLTFALVAQPARAEGSAQCQAHPVCSANSAPSAQPADLLLPAPPLATASGSPFLLQYIGQCCQNNDSSLCPAVQGFANVVCAFPMCSAGILSCVYYN